jgi:hypothetical protein
VRCRVDLSMSAIGQRRKTRPEHLLSAIPPKADFARSLRDVDFVPTTDKTASLANKALSTATAAGTGNAERSTRREPQGPC